METTKVRPAVANAQADGATVDAKHVSWLLILGIIWGSSYLFIKVLVEAVSPAVMIAGRFALGFLTLSIILKVRGGHLPRWGRPWALLLIMSIVGNVIPFFLIAWAEQHTTSALAAVLSATTPLFTLIFAASVFGIDRLSRDRVLGLVIGFAGVAMLTGRSILDIASTSGLGALALLGSSVCYGFSFAFARQYIRGNPASNVTAQSLISLVLITPFVILTGWVRTEHLHASNIAAWVVLGAVGTGIAYLFYYALISEIGATPASLVTYIIPVVGLILGWLVLDERLGLNGIAGMLLIVAGVAVSYGWHRRGNRQQAIGNRGT
jgi:drug/metabolite transporter (DMT)-like permease